MHQTALRCINWLLNAWGGGGGEEGRWGGVGHKHNGQFQMTGTYLVCLSLKRASLSFERLLKILCFASLLRLFVSVYKPLLLLSTNDVSW